MASSKSIGEIFFWWLKFSRVLINIFIMFQVLLTPESFERFFARWNYGLNFCRNFYLLSFEALKTGYSLRDTIMRFFGKKYFRHVNHNAAPLHSKTFQRKFWLLNFDNLVFYYIKKILFLVSIILQHLKVQSKV